MGRKGMVKPILVLALLLAATGTALSMGMMQGGRHMGMGMMRGAVPAAYSGKSNPVPATAEAVAAGAQLYQANCAACHGQKGYGDGPAGKQLSPRPANLSSLMRMSGRARDDYLMWTISEGRGAMPQFKQALIEEERWKIVRFLRTL